MDKEKQDYIDKLTPKWGLIGQAGVDRTTHNEYMNDEEYRDAYNDIEMDKKDMYEMLLITLCKSGNAQAMTTVAKSKLRDRGYGNDGDNALDFGDVFIEFDD